MSSIFSNTIVRMVRCWALRLAGVVLLAQASAATAAELRGAFETIGPYAANASPTIIRGRTLVLTGWAWDDTSGSNDGIAVKVYVNGQERSGQATFAGTDPHWSYALPTETMAVGSAVSIQVKASKDGVTLPLEREDVPLGSYPFYIDAMGWLDSFTPSSGSAYVINQQSSSGPPSVVQGGTVTLQGWVKDPVTLTSAGVAIKVYLDGSSTALSGSASFAGNYWTYTLTTGSLSTTSVHSILVKAEGAGGSSVLSHNFNSGGTLDTALTFFVTPIGWWDTFAGVAMNTQAAGTALNVTAGNTVTLSGSATNPMTGTNSGVSVKILVDDVQVGTGTFAGSSAQWNCSLSTTNLPLGPRTAKVTVTPPSGGTVTLNFDYSNQVPQTQLPIVVNKTPAVQSAPQPAIAALGWPASFSATVTGYPSPSVMWWKNGVPMTGATDSTLSIAMAGTGDVGTYLIEAVNSLGQVYSTSASLAVVTTQPTDRMATVGGNATFTVGVSHSVNSSTALSYQWKKNGADIANATNATLTINGVTTGSIGNYGVTVKNGTASYTSASGYLTVSSAPYFSASPQSLLVALHASASFSATVTSGTAPYTYQWRKGTTAIAGATTSTFTISSVESADLGSYNVVATDASNISVTSSNATLAISGGYSLGGTFFIADTDYEVPAVGETNFKVTVDRTAAQENIESGPNVRVRAASDASRGADVEYVVAPGVSLSKSIRLKPPFRVERGARFVARVSTTVSGSDAPVITSPLLRLALKDSPFTPYTITAINNPTSYEAVDLPGGLSFDGVNKINGTPSVLGEFSSKIRARKGAQVDEKILVWRISALGSTAVDTDGDGIPDSVEALLGSNSNAKDTLNSANPANLKVHKPQ